MTAATAAKSDGQEPGRTLERRELSAPVREVLLMEDRAHVTRRARVSLPEGTHRLRISEVSPIIADKTLTAQAWPVRKGEGRGGAPARVHDVRVRREVRVLMEDKSEEVRALDEEIRTAAAQKAIIDGRRLVATKELEGVKQLGELTVAEIGEDAAWDRGSQQDWGKALDRLAAAERELTERIVALDFEVAELDERLQRKQARRGALHGPGARKLAWLEIDLTAVGSGEHEVVVSYLVPGACWRPRHTARLVAGKAPRVHMECEGCAWQNTGEDWVDVDLCFSTERAALGAEPPLLESDVLAVTRKSATLVVQERDQRIEQAGLGAGEPRAEGLPGIDDGGDVQRLRARHKASLPSDGRPYRVSLFAFEASAETELVTMPELEAAVILKSVQTNAGPHPLLAGPVDLIQDSGFVGRASILFVAPGEKFALGWGPDGALRVQREVEQLKEESNLIGSWITRAQEVRVHLSNLGSAPKQVRVTERVPVSEIEKVQITALGKETTENKRPDDKGFLQWLVTLPAFGRETVRLRYVVKKHSDVVGL